MCYAFFTRSKENKKNKNSKTKTLAPQKVDPALRSFSLITSEVETTLNSSIDQNQKLEKNLSIVTSKDRIKLDQDSKLNTNNDSNDLNKNNSINNNSNNLNNSINNNNNNKLNDNLNGNGFYQNSSYNVESSLAANDSQDNSTNFYSSNIPEIPQALYGLAPSYLNPEEEQFNSGAFYSTAETNTNYLNSGSYSNEAFNSLTTTAYKNTDWSSRTSNNNNNNNNNNNKINVNNYFISPRQNYVDLNDYQSNGYNINLSLNTNKNSNSNVNINNSIQNNINSNNSSNNNNNNNNSKGTIERATYGNKSGDNKSHGENWNESFAPLLESILQISEVTTCQEKCFLYTKMIHLYRDFIATVEIYGQVIIRELYTPAENKTIKPLAIGGIAGGEKYLVQNILFKFAVDVSNVFDGNNEAAAKMAGHDLRGLIACFSVQISQLYYPLCALFDYRGHRLIAMTLLPISSKTLAYGSNDGGVTVRLENTQLSNVMKELGERLNLKPHTAGSVKNKENLNKTIYTAADVEGHVGNDGRFYLIDFARLFPPEFPLIRGFDRKYAHLYKLLRPELVLRNSVPLCPDALSGFVVGHPDFDKHTYEIKAATFNLIGKLIPQLAIELDSLTEEKLNAISLPETFHRAGVNMRYLKQVIYNSKKKFIKQLLLIEMITRALKTITRAELRDNKKRCNKESTYQNRIVHQLNLYFSNTNESNEFWDTILLKEIDRKFPLISIEKNLDYKPISLNTSFTSSKNDSQYEFQLSQTPFEDPIVKSSLKKYVIENTYDNKNSIFVIIFKKLQEMIGIKLNTELESDSRIFEFAKVFDDSDLESVGYRLKPMTLINHASCVYYKSQAHAKLNTRNKYECDVYMCLEKALQASNAVLRTVPDNAECLSLSCFICLLLNKYEEGKQRFERLVNLHLTESQAKLRSHFYGNAANYMRDYYLKEDAGKEFLLLLKEICTPEIVEKAILNFNTTQEQAFNPGAEIEITCD
eukprot:TRINITY_DN1648_c0_g1_i1.p1 TRINITY_DN1648_c0_g1~~TRINITY_DN1648_c0_g1_i1.p1  ORF type:complete len:984 (-),score=453.01 TRINITY_DN1648_c0_g1_i1:328-3279(-)